MSGNLQLKNATKVRVELVVDGITYEVELTGADVTFGIENDVAVVPSDAPWVVREPTGFADIQLRAFGKIVTVERRHALALGELDPACPDHGTGRTICTCG